MTARDWKRPNMHMPSKPLLSRRRVLQTAPIAIAGAAVSTTPASANIGPILFRIFLAVVTYLIATAPKVIALVKSKAGWRVVVGETWEAIEEDLKRAARDAGVLYVAEQVWSLSENDVVVSLEQKGTSLDAIVKANADVPPSTAYINMYDAEQWTIFGRNPVSTYQIADLGYMRSGTTRSLAPEIKASGATLGRICGGRPGHYDAEVAVNYGKDEVAASELVRMHILPAHILNKLDLRPARRS